MNEIFKLFGSIGLHTDEAENGLDKVNAKGESTTSGLMGTFKKAAVGIGAVFAAGKIIDFTKETVEAAADADAMRSQYSQVFGDMKGQADDMAGSMAEKFGMIPEQLQPGMIKFESMFKGVGMNAQDAMKSTGDATTAAADAAAFANISYDEAQGALQSFILGNYEAGDAIGIQANDNALAQYAIQQGAVKTTAEWQKMGDAQKEQMRIGFVQHMQQLSGVQGQAQRESGSFAVQMDKLKAIWTQFLATIGTPILAAVLPILQGLATGAGVLLGWIKQIMPNMNQATGGINSFGNNLKSFFTPIINSLAPIVRNAFTVISSTVRSVMSSVGSFLRSILNQIAAFWKQNGTQIMQAVQVAFNMIRNVIVAVMPYILNIIRNTWNTIKGVIQGAVNIIEGIIKVFSGILRGDWSAVWSGVKQIAQGAWQAISSIVSGAINNVKNSIGAGMAYARSIIGNMMSVIGRLFSNGFNSARSTVSSVMNSIGNAVSNGISWIRSLFNFHISFPHIPLPHFSVSGSANPLDWIKGSGVPHIGIEWYAKGGIMNAATAFGMNGNNVMVGGEAGQEAVLPLNRDNLGMIGAGIAATMGGNDNSDIIAAIKSMAATIVAAVMEARVVNVDGQALTDRVETLLMKGVTV